MWVLFDYHASFFAGFSWTFFYGKGFENKSFRRSSNHHFLKSDPQRPGLAKGGASWRAIERPDFDSLGGDVVDSVAATVELYPICD